MSEKVFAYGSNMCSGRFRAYSVSPEGPGKPAFLRGYRLCFNKRSTRDHSGKANVEPQAGAEVWGVVYEIPEGQLRILDNGEGGYDRREMIVHTARGEAVEAWVYVARTPDPDSALRPYTWYKHFLVEGALEHGLPDTYIADLRAIEAVEDPDRARDQRKRELACSE
ncbi:MAG: gamma-glutamylcyclotransferase [Deltaproteobacteria bacterium]|nr:gamma-glutamylcyclotransferase [Deltaproteobacteria bacterium]